MPPLLSCQLLHHYRCMDVIGYLPAPRTGGRVKRHYPALGGYSLLLVPLTVSLHSDRILNRYFWFLGCKGLLQK